MNTGIPEVNYVIVRFISPNMQRAKERTKERERERGRGKQRDRCGGCLLLIWMPVQPAALGSGLSFNTNEVSTTQPVTVRLHYICWVWGALITHHCCSRCFLPPVIHMLLSLLFCSFIFCVCVSNFLSSDQIRLIREQTRMTATVYRMF